MSKEKIRKLVREEVKKQLNLQTSIMEAKGVVFDAKGFDREFKKTVKDAMIALKILFDVKGDKATEDEIDSRYIKFQFDENVPGDIFINQEYWDHLVDFMKKNYRKVKFPDFLNLYQTRKLQKQNKAEYFEINGGDPKGKDAKISKKGSTSGFLPNLTNPEKFLELLYVEWPQWEKKGFPSGMRKKKHEDEKIYYKLISLLDYIEDHYSDFTPNDLKPYDEENQKPDPRKNQWKQYFTNYIRDIAKKFEKNPDHPDIKNLKRNLRYLESVDRIPTVKDIANQLNGWYRLDVA